jgi:hypothetical protein
VSKEFLKDVGKINSIKRYLKNYKKGKTLKERIITNNIIILKNCFGCLPACKMLIFKLHDVLPELLPFLIYLKMIPDSAKIEISMNLEIIERLKKL